MENANNLFILELRKYIPKPGMSNLYAATLKETFSTRTNGHHRERMQLLSQTDELNIRLRNARELVVAGKPDSEDELSQITIQNIGRRHFILNNLIFQYLRVVS